MNEHFKGKFCFVIQTCLLEFKVGISMCCRSYIVLGSKDMELFEDAILVVSSSMFMNDFFLVRLRTRTVTKKTKTTNTATELPTIVQAERDKAFD